MERIKTSRAMGSVIAQARMAKGLTQDQLARDAGISRQLVNRLEMGTASGIALSKLLSILERLDCALLVDSDGQPLEREPSPSESRIQADISDDQDPMGLGYFYPLDESLFVNHKGRT